MYSLFDLFDITVNIQLKYILKDIYAREILSSKNIHTDKYEEVNHTTYIQINDKWKENQWLCYAVGAV